MDKEIGCLKTTHCSLMLTRQAILKSQPACSYALLIDSHKKPKIWTENLSPSTHSTKWRSKPAFPVCTAGREWKTGLSLLLVVWDKCLLGPTFKQHSWCEYYSSTGHVQEGPCPGQDTLVRMSEQWHLRWHICTKLILDHSQRSGEGNNWQWAWHWFIETSSLLNLSWEARWPYVPFPLECHKPDSCLV